VTALVGNIAPTELLIIAGLAVIIFGKRLPHVAARGYAQFRRMREALERMRRETGIDRELRDIEYSVREASRRAATELEDPIGLRAPRDDEESEEADGGAEDGEEVSGTPSEEPGEPEEPSAPGLFDDRRESG
jgi:Sec-independent protein translocase protein TatA